MFFLEGLHRKFAFEKEGSSWENKLRFPKKVGRNTTLGVPARIFLTTRAVVG